MSKSIPAEHVEQCRQEFEEYARYAYSVAWNRVRRQDGTRPHDAEDRVQAAVCHAWEHYPKLRLKRPDLPVKVAVRFAVISGCSYGKRCGNPLPYLTYRDALDGAAPLGDAALQIPQPAESPQFAAWAADTISKLPAGLRTLATGLSKGIPKCVMAQLMGTSEYECYKLVWRLQEGASLQPDLPPRYRGRLL